MALIIEILSLEMEGINREARRLESIIAQESIEAYVVPTAAAPDILQAMNVTRLPIFRINNITVWEGEETPCEDCASLVALAYEP